MVFLKLKKNNLSLGNLRPRAILIRGGGLGDFILTLPLLYQLQSSYDEVLVLTKPSYFCLVEKKAVKTQLFDLDSGIVQLSDRMIGSDIFTFWKDKEWVNELRNQNVENIFVLPAKPLNPPHIIESIFKVVDFVLPASFLSIPNLGDQWRENLNLWIHPGSGAGNKNIPFSFYKRTAEDWLHKNKTNHVTFSFGEADQSVLSSFKTKSFINSDRIQIVSPNSVEDYKKLLIMGVSEFWGNDSGPSHLAANLGMPTNVCFKSTDSKIWRPTGPRVRVHEFFQDAN